jgi:twitching motility protein PilI
MARRGSLKEYQDEIISKMEFARQNRVSDLILYFGFVSGGRNFLIDGRNVIEMTTASRLQPIPISKPWAIGAANIKGSVYCVTDFSILFGGEKTKRGKFIVLNDEIISGSALMIESLSGLFEKDSLSVVFDDPEMKEFPSWISGCYRVNNEKHYMINGEKLATDARFSKLQSGE